MGEDISEVTETFHRNGCSHTKRSVYFGFVKALGTQRFLRFVFGGYVSHVVLRDAVGHHWNPCSISCFGSQHSAVAIART